MERFINGILNIAIWFLFGLLMLGLLGGFANAEPYQIPDRNWEGTQNCNDGRLAGKHYMMVTSHATGKLVTFCMKAPANLPNSSWDNALAMELVRIADSHRGLPNVLYFEVKDIGNYEILLVLFNARTGEEYRKVVVYP